MCDPLFVGVQILLYTIKQGDVQTEKCLIVFSGQTFLVWTGLLKHRVHYKHGFDATAF